MKITLPEADRAILERWMKSRSTGDKQRSRARMLLMTADGSATKAIMATLDISNTNPKKLLYKSPHPGLLPLEKVTMKTY
jgi:hypothetical protein